jgi:hypothetical protein
MSPLNGIGNMPSDENITKRKQVGMFFIIIIINYLILQKLELYFILVKKKVGTSNEVI